MLTVPSTLGPHRLDAGRYIITSRFRCRSFDRRYVVGALSTGRCLPAVAPRVLVMGDEVRSRSFSPDNHFNRFQVTASRTTRKSSRPRASDRPMCCQPGNRRGLSASETDRQRRYSIRMQSRWNYARSAAQPHASSHAQGLEGKKTSSPSNRGRNMSLTSPLIDQAIALKTPWQGPLE
jgi:hypothetical protein